MWALVLALVPSLVLTGADLYVDADAVAGGNGTTSAPYKTIQEAVEAAEEGATIHIAAGTYDSGWTEDGFKNGSSMVCAMRNRVYIAKPLVLCGEDKERTFIVGAHASTAADSAGLGLGDDAVRCIGINASNVVISNLTITGGATKVPSANDNPDGNGGGIYAPSGLAGIYLVDCVVSNNVAQRGAGARYNNDGSGKHLMTAVRCWFHCNKAANRDPAVRGMTLVNCLVTHHAYGSCLVYAGTFVNCTFADNYCRSLGEKNTKAYNCIFADYMYKLDSSGCEYNNCGLPISEAFVTTSLTNEHCLFSIGYDQFIAPIKGNYRLHGGANVLNAGDMSYLSALSIPDAYKYIDFYGNAIDSTSGTCHLGCCQLPVTPTGGTLRFSDIPYLSNINPITFFPYNNRYMFDGAEPFYRGELAYLRSVAWPETVSLSVEMLAWAGLYGFAASGVDAVMRYPYLDGTYEIVPPKDPASTLTLTPVAASTVVYVQQNSTVATEDGTEEAPYKDLQAAINSISSGKGIIYCKGGMFSSGSVTYENLACRIGFTSKDIRIVGIGGPTNNFIVGGVDTSVAQDVWPYGMGDGATRCLYLGKSSAGSAIQGFTLTGGRTISNTSGNTGRRGAGAFLANGSQITDCVISNNVGCQGVAIHGTESGTQSTGYAFRCLVADNRQYAANGNEGTAGIIRTIRGAFLILANNFGSHFGGYDYQFFYNCSIYSSSSIANIINGFSTNYNSVISVPNATDNNNTIYGGVVQYSGGAHKGASCVKADPLFADPASGDLRLMAMSPARPYGTFDYSEDYHIFIGRDFYGNPFRMIDGKPICGAVQEFAPTVVTSGDGISPSGTNVLAVGETTMTFSATAARPFIGFAVNGTTQEVSGTTYTLDVSGAESFDTAFDVSAIYDTNWYVDANNGNDDTGTGTAANPMRTLVAALTNAVSGDVVHAAPGSYAEGVAHHSSGVITTTDFRIGCRAYVPSGVSLVSQGSATNTFIVGHAASNPSAGMFGCGSDAVRGVFMEANSSLVGFTVTGGHTDDSAANASSSDDNVIGGGILARNNTAVISDCIISNNAAMRGGGGYNGTYNRCRIAKNSIILGGNGGAVRGNGSGAPSNIGTAKLLNCIIDGNHGGPTLYFTALDSCTLAADNEDGNSATVGMTILRRSFRVCNTLILGEKDTYEQIGFSNCVFSAVTAGRIARNASATTNACLVAETNGELAVDEGYAPVIGSSLAVDAGDSSMYDSAAFGEKDACGNPRFANGARLDIGAVEAVWLPHYSRTLGSLVTVTAASPAVELAASGVRIPAGASLEATVGRIGKAGKTYVVTASVEAGGTCAIEKDGVAGPTLSAGANQTVKVASTSDFMDMAFSAADAATTLSGIRMNVGITVNFR